MLKVSECFFSICVPTRNRAETLFYCLKTLLHQDFDSYEIIVSDNCDFEDSVKTKEIVEELNSPKIKYFKTDSVLSMTANYEFILSKAKGKFILCIGDDDGLVINSLQYVFNFIETYKARIIKCPSVSYYWIGSHMYPKSLLSYPMDRPVTEIRCKSVLQKVANFELAYFNLPMLYYSFVSRDIIDEVIKEKGSFFQQSTSIDIYSGFVIAYREESYYLTDKPFSIAGLSSKSNGEAAFNDSNKKVTQEFFKNQDLEAEYEKFKVPLLPKLDLNTIVFLELLRFKKTYNVEDKDLSIKYRNIFLNMASRNPIFNKISDLGLAENFEKYQIYHDDLKEVKQNFLNTQVFYPNIGRVDNIICKHCVIDPNLFEIKNVYDAAIFCKKIIDSRENIIPIALNNLNSYLGSDSSTTRPIIKKIASRLKRTFRVFIGKE